MIKYNSFMQPMIEEFIKYRSASQHWNEVTHGRNLKTFENYCLKNFPNATILTQEMIDSWCSQRKSEQNKSYRVRIEVIVNFVKYTNERNITNLRIPEKPKLDKKTYIPHVFTEEELKKFFYACDNVEIKNKSKTEQYRKLAVPVFFRLLYSTGMRTTEARLLKRKNVDMKNNIINIEQEGTMYYALDNEAVLRENIIIDQGLEAKIWELNLDLEEETYVAEIGYKGCRYICNGMIPLEELEKILKSAYFL